MKIYYMALGIMIFSASIQISNDMGVFSHQLPNTKFDNINGTVTSLTTTASASYLETDMFGVGMILKSVGFMVNMLSSAVTIIPLSIKYGINYQVYLPIQGIIWFVYGMGLFQLLTGRSTKLYD